jgi:hypothetical protein
MVFPIRSADEAAWGSSEREIRPGRQRCRRRGLYAENARPDEGLAAALKRMITAISVPCAPPLRPLYKNAAIPMQRVTALTLIDGSRGCQTLHYVVDFLRERRA